MTPTDSCGRCGCERQHHNPPAWEPRTKGRYSQILARTCCSSCPHCVCFCHAWMEPFDGQPYKKCGYRDFLPPRKPATTVPAVVVTAISTAETVLE